MMNMAAATESSTTNIVPTAAASSTLATDAAIIPPPQARPVAANPQFPQHDNSYSHSLSPIQCGVAVKTQPPTQTTLSAPTISTANSGICRSQAQIQLGITLDQPCPRYPVASSGRGFVHSNPDPNPIQLHDYHLAATVAAGPYPPPRSMVMPYPPPQVVRPFILAPPDSMTQSQSHSMSQSQRLPIHLIRPSNPNFNVPPSMSIKGIPVSAHPHPAFKVSSSQCSAPEVKGHKASRERCGDDACVTVRDRKVRISDGSSMYALCRSWLRNGYPEETQPQIDDFMRSLPRPAPLPAGDTHSSKKEPLDEEECGMVEKAVESMSPQELLERHIKRAKRVRARLREERLHRIARYKSRLALLLPPLVDQCRDDPSRDA